MTDLVPRGRRDLTPRPRTAVEVRTIGGSLRQVTGTQEAVTRYLDAQLAAGVRVRLHETIRRGPGGTVIRVVELIPPGRRPAKRGPAPWWLIGSAILLGLTILGTVTIMTAQSLTELVREHPGWTLFALVLIAVFGGGTTFVFNFNRR